MKPGPAPESSTVHLLVNPASKRGARDGASVHRQLEQLGHCVERIEPGGPSEVAPSIASAGPERVIAVGGDGLIHHALPALVGADIALGIVPSGTGNDFARALELPKRRASAVARALGHVTAVDLLRIDFADETSTWAATAVTAGFSGRVTATANALRFPKGQLKYTIASLAELRSLQTFEAVASGLGGQDRAELNGPCAFFAVANTRYFGGGMAIAPKAVATDGRLHLTVVGAVPAWQLALVLPSVFVGQHVKHPRVAEASGHSVALSHDQEVWADGERIGAGNIVVTVVPESLFVAAF